MKIGDILIDTRNNQTYLVKAFMPKYPKRVVLFDLGDGQTFSILKSININYIFNDFASTK